MPLRVFCESNLSSSEIYFSYKNKEECIYQTCKYLHRITVHVFISLECTPSHGGKTFPVKPSILVGVSALNKPGQHITVLRVIVLVYLNSLCVRVFLFVTLLYYLHTPERLLPLQ